MTRDEIVDFLEWAKECGQLQFSESRKVDMAEMYIKEQDAVNKTCNIPHVMESDCDHVWLNHSFDHFGFLQEQICDKCGAKRSVS